MFFIGGAGNGSKDLGRLTNQVCPGCDMMVPPLSTMKVRKRELGATAVQRLLDRVADPKRECLKMCMATKLVKRQSVSRR